MHSATIQSAPTRPALRRASSHQAQITEIKRLAHESSRLRAAGQPTEAAQEADKALAVAREAFADDPKPLVEWLELAAGAHERADDYATAKKLRAELLSIQTKRFGADHWQTINARLSLADVDIWTGLKPEDRKALAHCSDLIDQVREARARRDYRAALLLAKESFDTRARILGPKHRFTAFAGSWLGLNYADLHQYADAEALFRQVLAIEEEPLGKTHPAYATDLNNLANVYYWQHDYAKAEPLYRQVVAIRLAAYGPKHVDYRIGVTNLANTLDKLAAAAVERENWQAARKLRMEFLHLMTDLHGQQDWRATDAQRSLADVDIWAGLKPDDRKALAHCDELMNQSQELQEKGELNTALPLLKESLAIRDRILGPKHHLTAYTYSCLGTLQDDLGQYADAEDSDRHAMEVQEAILGTMHPDYAITLNNMALLYDDLGDYARSESFYRQTLEIAKKSLGEKSADYATCLDNLASLYKQMGEYARAEPLLLQGLEIRKQVYGKSHVRYATSLNNLAMLYKAMGDYVRAKSLLRQSIDIYKELSAESNLDYVTSVTNLAEVYESNSRLRPRRTSFSPGDRIPQAILGRKASRLRLGAGRSRHALPDDGRLRSRRTSLPPDVGNSQATLGRKAPRLCQFPERTGAALQAPWRIRPRRASLSRGIANPQANPRRKASRLRRQPERFGHAVPDEKPTARRRQNVRRSGRYHAAFAGTRPPMCNRNANSWR